MIVNTTPAASRTLRLAFGLTLAVTALAPRPAIAADPIWGLLTGLIRTAAPAPDGPADNLSDAERAELLALKPGNIEIRRMLETAVVAQQPATSGGYQTMQNTVNAAVTYWTGQPTHAAQPAVAYGDPYGFTSWLNGVRAQYGLGPVSYDSDLSAWANMNNAQQNNQGLGHHVMGPARRQNSAMGDAASIGGQWLASPAHAAALLDPSIRVIGIAGMGAYWTFNAY